MFNIAQQTPSKNPINVMDQAKDVINSFLFQLPERIISVKHANNDKRIKNQITFLKRRY